MPTQADLSERIRVGIAGWSYPDWEGYVYPPGTTDKLRYVAQFVDVVEINSTFYRPPDARTAASWVRRVADLPDFRFTAKLSQEVTHKGQISEATVRAFHEGLHPLADSGRLTHVLAQFKWDFVDKPEARHHLEAIRAGFGDMAQLALELRSRTWQEEGALAFLRGLGVTVANLDYPQSRDAFSLRLCDVGEDAYLRLHGRNAKAWFSKDAGRDETYNYLYSSEELTDIVDRAVALAKMSRSLTLVANNHYQGKEVLNALEIKARITGRPVQAPPDLVKRYPRLRDVTRPPAAPQPEFPF